MGYTSVLRLFAFNTFLTLYNSTFPGKGNDTQKQIIKKNN